MESGNLKVVKDVQIRHKRAPAPAIVIPIVKSIEQPIPGPVVVRRGLRLDVDEVLRRSLPTWPNQNS